MYFKKIKAMLVLFSYNCDSIGGRCNRVIGWIDLALFFDFRKWKHTVAVDLVFFNSSIPKTQQVQLLK